MGVSGERVTRASAHVDYVSDHEALPVLGRVLGNIRAHRSLKHLDRINSVPIEQNSG